MAAERIDADDGRWAFARTRAGDGHVLADPCDVVLLAVDEGPACRYPVGTGGVFADGTAAPAHGVPASVLDACVASMAPGEARTLTHAAGPGRALALVSVVERAVRPHALRTPEARLEEARAARGIARALAAQGHAAAAEAHLHRALAYLDPAVAQDALCAGPERRALWLNLARLAARRADHAAVRSWCGRVLAADRGNTPATILLARALAATGDADEAETLLSRRVLCDGDADPALVAVARADLARLRRKKSGGP